MIELLTFDNLFPPSRMMAAITFSCQDEAGSRVLIALLGIEKIS